MRRWKGKKISSRRRREVFSPRSISLVYIIGSTFFLRPNRNSKNSFVIRRCRLRELVNSQQQTLKTSSIISKTFPPVVMCNERNKYTKKRSSESLIIPHFEFLLDTYTPILFYVVRQTKGSKSFCSRLLHNNTTIGEVALISKKRAMDLWAYDRRAFADPSQLSNYAQCCFSRHGLNELKLQVHHNPKRSHSYEYLQQVGHSRYGIVGKMQYYAITYQ